LPEKDVLVVDDEAAVREVLAGILQDAGYVVDMAATLAEAKKLICEHRYGVVLADWRLPDGDGSLVANLATAAGSHAFVMSGYLAKMLPGIVDARQTLMKPIMRAELLAAVRDCIGESPTRDGAEGATG
jgi:DNA-binding response OmpR family regulator